jgi:hypothetical protein
MRARASKTSSSLLRDAKMQNSSMESIKLEHGVPVDIVETADGHGDEEA